MAASWKRIAGIGTGVGVALAAPGAAQADSFTVNSLADTTDGTCDETSCTLREAIQVANAFPFEEAEIQFTSGLSGTISLTSDLPGLNEDMAITGPGPKASTITISGGDARRIFEAGDHLTIRNLKLIDGKATGRGGAINGVGGFVYVYNSEISSSSASTDGGAISLSIYGTLEVVDSTLSGNHADGDGGAIRADYGSAIEIRNSTITGNTAGGAGGGALLEDNTYGGSVTAKMSTITGNTSATGSGGVAVSGDEADLHINSSILSGNSPNAYYSDQTDAIYSDVPASIVGLPLYKNFTADPQLGPLHDNGGPTPTMKPAIDSPVIDQGSSNLVDDPFDQRGLSRVFDAPAIANASAGTDVGAVELTAAELGLVVNPPPPPPGPTPTPPKFDLAAALKKCKKKKSKKAKKKCVKKARAQAKG